MPPAPLRDLDRIDSHPTAAAPPYCMDTGERKPELLELDMDMPTGTAAKPATPAAPKSATQAHRQSREASADLMVMLLRAVRLEEWSEREWSGVGVAAGSYTLASSADGAVPTPPKHQKKRLLFVLLFPCGEEGPRPKARPRRPWEVPPNTKSSACSLCYYFPTVPYTPTTACAHCSILQKLTLAAARTPAMTKRGSVAVAAAAAAAAAACLASTGNAFIAPSSLAGGEWEEA